MMVFQAKCPPSKRQTQKVEDASAESMSLCAGGRGWFCKSHVFELGKQICLTCLKDVFVHIRACFVQD